MQLIPDLTTVVAQIVNFLVLAGLLYWLVFRPVLKSVRTRATEKEVLLAQIQRDHDAASRMKAELAARLEVAEEEAREVLTKARDDAAAERVTLLEETQSEVERILVEARADAFRVRQQAVDEFHDALLSAILDISGMVVARLAPEEMHATLVKQLTDRIWEMGRREMRRVETFRQALGDRTPTAYVTTARPLGADLQGLLARTFTALADRNVNLDIQVDPDLAVGLKVRLGDIVVDNSVAGQLEALRGDVMSALEERLGDE